MGIRGGVKLTPPSVSWFSSTPAGIGLKSSNRCLSVFINITIIVQNSWNPWPICLKSWLGISVWIVLEILLTIAYLTFPGLGGLSPHYPFFCLRLTPLWISLLFHAEESTCLHRTTRQTARKKTGLKLQQTKPNNSLQTAYRDSWKQGKYVV